MRLVDDDLASFCLCLAVFGALMGSRKSVEIALDTVRDALSEAQAGEAFANLKQAVLDLCGAAHEEQIPVETLLERLKASLQGERSAIALAGGGNDVVRNRVVALTIAGYYAGVRLR